VGETAVVRSLRMRASLALLLLVALLSGVSSAAHPCAYSGASEAKAEAATAKTAEMPCHAAASGALQSGKAAPKSRPAPASPHGKGCCDPASGVSCPHACQLLALGGIAPLLTTLAVTAPLAFETSPGLLPPLPRGLDHIPLA